MTLLILSAVVLGLGFGTMVIPQSALEHLQVVSTGV
jgi:hypothetical protein